MNEKSCHDLPQSAFHPGDSAASQAFTSKSSSHEVLSASLDQDTIDLPPTKFLLPFLDVQGDSREQPPSSYLLVPMQSSRDPSRRFRSTHAASQLGFMDSARVVQRQSSDNHTDIGMSFGRDISFDLGELNFGFDSKTPSVFDQELANHWEPLPTFSSAIPRIPFRTPPNSFNCSPLKTCDLLRSDSLQSCAPLVDIPGTDIATCHPVEGRSTTILNQDRYKNIDLAAPDLAQLTGSDLTGFCDSWNSSQIPQPHRQFTDPSQTQFDFDNGIQSDFQSPAAWPNSYDLDRQPLIHAPSSIGTNLTVRAAEPVNIPDSTYPSLSPPNEPMGTQSTYTGDVFSDIIDNWLPPWSAHGIETIDFENGLGSEDGFSTLKAGPSSYSTGGNGSPFAFTRPINSRNGQRDKSKDEFLVRCKSQGLSYKEIKQRGGFTEAESTLRGRYRALTKPKEARLRKPEWSERDVSVETDSVRPTIAETGKQIQILFDGVSKCSSTGLDAFDSSGNLDTVAVHSFMNRVPWKQVAEYMESRGTYRYGNATVKKKYVEMLQKRPSVRNCHL